MANRSFHLARAGFVALALSLAAGGAFAAGSGGGDKPNKPSCPTGQVWDEKKGCVNASGSNLEDQDLLEQGTALAKAGRYDDALQVFAAAKDRNDSQLLTMIGYATRKLGQYDEGVAYYHQALAINPDNVNTHEYLGEAYAEMGQIELAKAELTKVEALCGTECEQYEDLAKAIEGESGW
jgi:tetratricopeptide (TPR) repeat protein